MRVFPIQISKPKAHKFPQNIEKSKSRLFAILINFPFILSILINRLPQEKAAESNKAVPESMIDPQIIRKLIKSFNKTANSDSQARKSSFNIIRIEPWPSS